MADQDGGPIKARRYHRINNVSQQGYLLGNIIWKLTTV